MGESGYIFVSLTEAESIASFLGLEFASFLLRYVKKVGYRFSLLEKPYNEGFACAFFDTEAKCCGIYAVRPRQCRSFPFWESLREPSALEQLCALCPGVRVDSLRGESEEIGEEIGRDRKGAGCDDEISEGGLVGSGRG